MNWNHSHCLHVGRVMLSSSQSAIDVAYASLSACVAYSPFVHCLVYVLSSWFSLNMMLAESHS